MSIQDDINQLDPSGSAKGQCAKCGDENLYSSIACSGCGARLPWADAVKDRARATASTHAPLSIASARATVHQPPGAPGSGAGPGGSGGSRGPLAPTVAMVLLIAGGLMGAAVVVPNFISRSQTVQPTPTMALQNPAAAPTPSALPAVRPSSAPDPQFAPAAVPATPGEKEFLAAVTRSFDLVSQALRSNVRNHVARANAKGLLDQAAIQMNVALPSERLVGMGVLSITQQQTEAIFELRMAFSQLDMALDEQGQLQDREALDEAMKGVQSAKALSMAAAQKMNALPL